MAKPAAPPRLAPQNLLDKALAYVAPQLAMRRLQARGMLAIAGGYTGARIDRAALAAWTTQAGSPDRDVIVDLPMLRQRSRDLERNAPIAAGVINTTAAHAVGTGLSCNPQVDAEYLGLDEDQAAQWQLDVRRRFKAWAECADCDLARFQNFYGLQDLGLRGALVSGDTFVLTPRVARSGGGEPRLALQVIEADLVCNPDRKQDTATLTAGIEHSPVTGEAIAYHVASQHPGDARNTASITWTRVAARGSSTGRRNVLHLFRQLRPGLRRGVPILAPVIEPLKQLARYTDAELQAAVTSGLFSVFVKMDPTAFQDLFAEDAQAAIVDGSKNWSGALESGKAVNLLPGESIETSNPGRPNAQFDPFVTSCVRQIGMALGIPYEVLVMHYQSSYSAARGALLMAWRFFHGWRDWLATHMCQPVYELWLSEEVAAGRIAAPGFFADDVSRHAWSGCQWVGDGPGSIDPGKEVDAARARVELGISTLQAESILHDGVDWETKHRQTLKETEARKEAGLEHPGLAPPEPVVMAPPPPPEATPEETANDQADAALKNAMAWHFNNPAKPPDVNVTVQPPAISVQVEAPEINLSMPKTEVYDEIIEHDERGHIQSIKRVVPVN